MSGREYSLVRETTPSGVWFALVRTNYRHVEVWGVGSSDYKEALRRAKDYCKNTFAKLHIEAKGA